MQARVELKETCGEIPKGAQGWVIGIGYESGIAVQSITPYGGGEYEVEWDMTHLEIEFDHHGKQWFDESDVNYIKDVFRPGDVKDYTGNNTPAPKVETPTYDEKDIPF